MDYENMRNDFAKIISSGATFRDYCNCIQRMSDMASRLITYFVLHILCNIKNVINPECSKKIYSSYI